MEMAVLATQKLGATWLLATNGGSGQYTTRAVGSGTSASIPYCVTGSALNPGHQHLGPKATPLWRV